MHYDLYIESTMHRADKIRQRAQAFISPSNFMSERDQGIALWNLSTACIEMVTKRALERNALYLPTEPMQRRFAVAAVLCDNEDISRELALRLINLSDIIREALAVGILARAAK